MPLQPRTTGTLLEEPSSRKRTFHNFFHSEGPTETSQPSPPGLRLSTTPSPPEPPDMSRPTSLPRRRFVGDGFDYRRPIMSTSTRQRVTSTSSPRPAVIDLTNDPTPSRNQPISQRTSVDRRSSRPPRPSRNHTQMPGQIGESSRSGADTQRPGDAAIDLESLDVAASASAPSVPLDEMPTGAEEDFLPLQHHPPSSPGFEILGERSLQPDAPRRSLAERRPTPFSADYSPEPSGVPPPPPALFEHLPNGLAGWIAQAGSGFMGSLRPPRIEHPAIRDASMSNQLSSFEGPYRRPAESSGWNRHPQVQLPRLAALDFERPRLNYEAQGFELITAARASPPPRPTSPYKGPGAAAAGFTRQLAEEDIAVCPLCGDELRTGNGELKEQIWVAKQCGHVYCGECATNRQAKKSKKGSSHSEVKATPFKNCVVPGCKKLVTSKTAFFQVYL